MKKIVKEFEIKDYLVDNKAKDLSDKTEIFKKTSLEITVKEKEMSVEEKEMGLAKILKLKRQIAIREMDALGFPVIREEFIDYFGETKKVNFDIDYYNGLIPLKFLNKINECKDIFEYFFIIEEEYREFGCRYRILYGKKVIGQYHVPFYIASIGRAPTERESEFEEDEKEENLLH